MFFPDPPKPFFELNRVYKRRGIEEKAIRIVDDEVALYALVRPRAEGLLPLAVDFIRLKGSSKYRCIGVGRPEHSQHFSESVQCPAR